MTDVGIKLKQSNVITVRNKDNDDDVNRMVSVPMVILAHWSAVL